MVSPFAFIYQRLAADTASKRCTGPTRKQRPRSLALHLKAKKGLMSKCRRLTFFCLLTTLGLLAAPSFAAAAGDLTPEPTQLDLGTQGIHGGSTPPQEVKFTNLTGADLNVSSVSLVGADAADFLSNDNCSFVMDGTSCDASVSFNPATPGLKSAQIELVDDNGTVIVPLSGTAATGTLSGSSPSFDPRPISSAASSAKRESPISPPLPPPPPM